MVCWTAGWFLVQFVFGLQESATVLANLLLPQMSNIWEMEMQEDYDFLWLCLVM